MKKLVTSKKVMFFKLHVLVVVTRTAAMIYIIIMKIAFLILYFSLLH